MSSPYNRGYHRRHKCKDEFCGHAFYSLAPYDGSEVEISPLPFEDHPISEYEQMKRMELWREVDAQYMVTLEVPLYERIKLLTKKDAAKHTEVEAFIMKMYTALQKRVQEMENADPG